MSNTIELNCFLHPIVEMNVTFIFVEIFEELTCYYFLKIISLNIYLYSMQ